MAGLPKLSELVGPSAGVNQDLSPEKKKLTLPPMEQPVSTGGGLPKLRDLISPSSSQEEVKESNPGDLTTMEDLGMMGIATVAALGVGAVLFPPAWPALGTAIAYGAVGGGLYGLGKTAAEQLKGKETSPEDYLKSPAIEAATWAAFPPALKGLGKLAREARPLYSGWLEQPLQKAYKPVSDAIWGGVTVMGKKIPGVSSVGKMPLPMPESWGGGKVTVAGKAGSEVTRWKNLSEMTVASVERLREKAPKVARTFDVARRQESTAKAALRSMPAQLDTLAPTERHSFNLAAKQGSSDGLVADKGTAMWDEMTAVKLSPGITAEWQDGMLGGLSKLVSKNWGEIETAFPAGHVRDILAQFEGGLTGKQNIKPKEYWKVLDNIISSNRVPEPVREYAKSIYNMPATFAQQVAESSRKSTTDYILNKLINTKGATSVLAKEGYTQSKHTAIKDLWVDKDVELELNAIRDVPKMANTMMNKYFMSPWKTNKLMLRPAAHMRNLLGNAILNDWGGLSFARVDIYNRAIQEMRGKSPDFKRFLANAGEMPTFSSEDCLAISRQLTYGAGKGERLLNIFDHITAPAKGWYSAEETWFKFAKYLYNTEGGMGKTEAAMDAIKWTFNYGEVTPFVAKLRGAPYGAPFATWTTKVIPLFAETAIKHPLRVGKWLAFYEAMQANSLDSLNLSEEEFQQMKNDMPEYIKNGMFMLMPWRGEQGELKMMNLTWMVPGIGDLSEVYQRGVGKDPFSTAVTLVVQNPIANFLGSVMTNRKFSGAPIYYEWESPAVRLQKVFSLMWETFTPALAPGNIDYRTLSDAIQGVPGSLTSGEALSSTFGARLTSVDPVVARQRHAAIQRIHQQEMTAEMKRKLRKAKDPVEAQEIMDEYNQIKFEAKLEEELE